MQIPYSGLFFQLFLCANLFLHANFHFVILFFNLCFHLRTRAQIDFKPVLLELLTTHPGLEFLQSTPEFQERYGMFAIIYLLLVGATLIL